MLILKSKTPSFQIPCAMHDEHSDLLILMGQNIIPVHSYVLSNYSPFFLNMHSLNSSCQHRVQIITQPLQIETVISVFKYHYGHQLSLSRNQQLIYFMEVVTFFGFRSLRDQLLNDLMKNFEKYDISFVLQFAKQFRLQKLQHLCWSKLKESTYQQTEDQEMGFRCCEESVFLEIMEKKTQNKKNRSKKVEKAIWFSNGSNYSDFALTLLRKQPEKIFHSNKKKSWNSIFLENPETLSSKEKKSPIVLDKLTEKQINFFMFSDRNNPLRWDFVQLNDQEIEVDRKHILFDASHAILSNIQASSPTQTQKPLPFSHKNPPSLIFHQCLYFLNYIYQTKQIYMILITQKKQLLKIQSMDVCIR